jgi:hypothetical protein
MISEEFRFRQFADIAAGKEHHQIISLAEQEALEAWRQAHPSKGLAPAQRNRSLDYQRKLLSLIEYLRRGIEPIDCDERLSGLFRSIQRAAASDDLVAG